MISHENRLLADDSHEISFLISFEKLGKMKQNLSSAAAVIGALRVNLKQFQNNYACKELEILSNPSFHSIFHNLSAKLLVHFHHQCSLNSNA